MPAQNRPAEESINPVAFQTTRKEAMAESLSPRSIVEVSAKPQPPSIGDYYDKCVNCHHGVCITESLLGSTKGKVDAEARDFQSFLDEVEQMEFSVSTITSAFLQQKRALEKELLALDLAYSAMSQEQVESEAKREDFLRRAQRHVTQRNFLRRFAGQQQIQLVHEFSPRVYGRGARGGGPSDDTLFRPVVMETNASAKGEGSSAVGLDAEMNGTSYGWQQTSAPRTALSVAPPQYQSPSAAGRRQSSNESRRSTVNNRVSSRTDSVASDASRHITRERHRRGDEDELTDTDGAEDGIEDIIKMIKSQKNRRRKGQGNTDLEHSRRKSSSSTSVARRVGATKQPTTPPVATVTKGGPTAHAINEGLSPAQSMRRVRLVKSQETVFSELDAADRAAEARSSEVDLLIKRLDNSSVEERSQSILEWYRAKRADEDALRARQAEAAEATRKAALEEQVKALAEAETLERQRQRERLLFSKEYSTFRKGQLFGESLCEAMPATNTKSECGSVTSAVPVSPMPPKESQDALNRRSILDNPKYRMAAMKAMAGHAGAIKVSRPM